MSEQSIESKGIHWTMLLEKYFSDTAEKCYCYSYLHKKAEQLYEGRRIFIDLPCIILATINGATSIGSQSLFEGSKMASVGIGVVAIFTATLQTIGSYFGWAKRSESHRIASLQYAKLYRTIAVDLGLPRNERAYVKDFLKNVKEQYDRLQETSPLVPSLIIKQFKTTFSSDKYKDISKPSETNGLEAVIVYDPKKDTEIYQEVEDEIEKKPVPITIDSNGSNERVCFE
jgi:hypothetical protein